MADKGDNLFHPRKGKNSGPARIISLDQYRWRKAGQVLRRKLGEFATDSTFSREMSKAQQLYLVGLNPDILDENEDIIMERCFEWFIFDYVIDNGVTPIEIYAAQNSLSGMEKQLLDDWTGSRLSLFEVKGAESGKGLDIEDLLFSRQIVVNNFDVAGKVEKGSIIYMRVLKVGSEFEFSTGGFGLPPAYAGRLLEKIQVDVRKYTSKKASGRVFLEKYLRDRAHIINSWVLDLAHRSYSQDLDEDELSLLQDTPGAPDRLSLKIAQQITDAFLDDYYERWINQPLQALDGKTPRESGKTVHGRARLEEILKELEKMERGRAKKGEPNYDINKVRVRLGLLHGDGAQQLGAGRDRPEGSREIMDGLSWPGPEYARVALLLIDRLKEKGYSHERMAGAVKLWSDYCARNKPGIRKESIWVAAVEYAMARIEYDSTVNQRKLAAEFGINASSLSERFRLLCSSLDLTVFDRRYSSEKTPVGGLELSDPVLAKILYNLKL